MSTESFSRFFATLALATFAATLVVVVLWVVARANPESAAAELFAGVQSYALWLAWIVAAVTTLGSLYYSLVAHFEPCELCWYQRICVYPLSVVLLIAALRHDYGVWRYALPPAIVGIFIAVYHSQLQAFPSQQTFCSQTNPCTIRYVWQFGFVSLPLMDLAALLFVTTMLFVGRAAERSEHVAA
jgi:disulfide bond formation protein DsbB